MALFGKPKYSTVTISKKRDIPADLFVKCPISGEVIPRKELEENGKVVPKSGYHFPLTAQERIRLLLDPDTFQEKDGDLRSMDPLNFRGTVSYADKLEENRRKTGMEEAVLSGLGKIAGIPIAVAAMDFRFLGASMGSVVGEKITRTLERGADEKIPVLVVCASGGARMYEGILSLMQMAKTCAAVARLSAVGQPYLVLLTHPTTAGVIASFASLGDIILAEPGALIGFAGPRVIREITGQNLPPGFQTAEFLLGHGFLDQIVPRSELRPRLIHFLKAFTFARGCSKKALPGK
jgi:acetyl-CoA carboxylase carboxyl transferase subunit beta